VPGKHGWCRCNKNCDICPHNFNIPANSVIPPGSRDLRIRNSSISNIGIEKLGLGLQSLIACILHILFAFETGTLKMQEWRTRDWILREEKYGKALKS